MRLRVDGFVGPAPPVCYDLPQCRLDAELQLILYGQSEDAPFWLTADRPNLRESPKLTALEKTSMMPLPRLRRLYGPVSLKRSKRWSGSRGKLQVEQLERRWLMSLSPPVPYPSGNHDRQFQRRRQGRCRGHQLPRQHSKHSVGGRQRRLWPRPDIQRRASSLLHRRGRLQRRWQTRSRHGQRVRQ